MFPIVQIDNAQTEEDIDSILEESENMSIINSSGWPVTQQITLANKTALLQGLIFDEVIAKRQDHIAAFQKGLEKLKVMALVIKHPQQMRKLFVYSDEILDADQLLSLIETPLTTPVTHQTWVWCKEYIVERSTEKTGEVSNNNISFCWPSSMHIKSRNYLCLAPNPIMYM